jgi:hypothetical protein
VQHSGSKRVQSCFEKDKIQNNCRKQSSKNVLNSNVLEKINFKFEKMDSFNGENFKKMKEIIIRY